MRLFAGIDAGQSSTAAVVAGEDGRVLARGAAGPADEVAQDATSTRLRDALGGALADALQNANLPGNSRFAGIVAGISGYEGRVYGKSPDLPSDRVTLVHDAPVAHAAALGGAPGVVVIAGTGSVAYGADERGTSVTVGGWGYLFGDEGSAFGIVRGALSDAMCDDDCGRSDRLCAELLEHFTQPSLRSLARAFYASEISRQSLAAFAKRVVDAAEGGDERAASYVREAAGALALLGVRAAARLHLDAPSIALAGGLARSTALRNEVDERLQVLLPSAQLVTARYDPPVGALLLAYRYAGLAIPAIVETAA